MFRCNLNRIYSFILLFIVVSTFFSCSGKKEATGQDDRIYIVSDSLLFENLKSDFESVFNKVILTPQPEQFFELIRIKFDDIESVKFNKNILIVINLNKNPEHLELLNSILSKELISNLKSQKAMTIIEENVWANNQTLVILTGRDLKSLKENISINNESLLAKFQKQLNRRLNDILKDSDNLKVDLEDKLMNDYGWKLSIPKNFDIALNIPQERFVWFRSSSGENYAQWIFVNWIDKGSPELINVDSIYLLRNQLTSKYFLNTDKKSFISLNRDFVKTIEKSFNGRYALYSQGLWEMNDKSKGGPFINYTFYDEKTNKIFMLDASIFAPKYFKKDLINQLDVILRTFQTK